jgi:predicted RND superfamily exporter protein
MSERLLGIYEKLILRHPVASIIAVIIVAIAMAFGLPNFKLDASADSLTLENDTSLAYFRESLQRYGSSDFLVVTYTPYKGDLFDDENLNTLAEIRDELTGIKGVETVTSMLDVPLLYSPKVSVTKLKEDPRTLLQEDTDRSMAKTEFLESPIYRDLILSKDGQTTALLAVMELDKKYLDLVNQRDTLRIKRDTEGLSLEETAELEQISQEFLDYRTIKAAEEHARVAEIREKMFKFKDRAEVFLGGPSMITADMVDFIKSDLNVFGTGIVLFIIITLAIIFRQFRWVLLPLVTCVLSVEIILGYLSWIDWRLTVISSNFVSLLLIITLALTIHLIVRYRELHREFPDKDQFDLVRDTVNYMARPCLYTVLTTIVAFVSLVVSDIRPVIDFGWMMTLGLGVSLIVCFLVFPALLAPLSAGKPRQGRDLSRELTLAFAGFTERRRPILLIVALAVIVASLWGVSRLTVENRFIDYFQKDTEIYQGMLQIDRKLGGTTPLDIVIDAPKTTTAQKAALNQPATGWDGDSMDDSPGDPFASDSADETGNADPFANSDTAAADSADPFADGDPFASEAGADPFATPKKAEPNPLKGAYWFTPARLGQLVDIQDYLESLPETGKVLSIATTYEVAEKLNGRPLSYVQLMLLASFIPDDLRNQLVKPYLSDDGDQVRISVRVIDSDKNLNRNELLAKIRTDLQNDFGLQPEQVHLTGAMVLYNNMLQSLFDSQIKTLGYVFAAILFMLLILFRSIPVALISMVPSLISASLVLGLMGWIGLPLDLMTITITAITIGIAVDDTIHYIHRFHEELPKDNDYVATMKRCHGSIGKAMYYTSLTIIAGFSILALSSFNPTVYFGLLTGLAMLVALLSNLTLLPSLLITVKPKLRAG